MDTAEEQVRRDVEEEIEFAYLALSRDFRKHIDQLTEAQRRAVLLVCILGYTQEEIAERLGISHQVIDRAIKASIQKIQKMFSTMGAKKATARLYYL